MPDYRRLFVPGGSYFFTLVTHNRRPLFNEPAAITLLGSIMRRCCLRWPIKIHAIVLLPDHWHTLWSLPPGDGNYSRRIGWLKKEFTKRWMGLGGTELDVSQARQRQRRRGIWQPRFWEHTLRDQTDFQHHFDYIHWNPVKHRYVGRPGDWEFSSFHRWVQRGVYPGNWGCNSNQLPPTSVRAVTDAGEPQ